MLKMFIEAEPLSRSRQQGCKRGFLHSERLATEIVAV
jgi:hypothetical protein